MRKTAGMLAVLMALACSRGEKQETGNRQQETGDRRQVAADGRTQRDLAGEIAEADRLRKDEREMKYGEIRASWLGKRVRWTVDVLPALCRSPETCHALPFDRTGADRSIVQGWMPRLRLDGASFAALQAGCAGRARCPVTVDGTIEQMTLSADEPTSLTLGAVELVVPLRVARAGQPANDVDR